MRSLFTHTIVYMPIKPLAQVRRVVYHLFDNLIPVTSQPDFVFRSSATDCGLNQMIYSKDEITIINIHLTRFWSRPHHEDFNYKSFSKYLFSKAKIFRLEKTSLQRTVTELQFLLQNYRLRHALMLRTTIRWTGIPSRAKYK